MGFFDRQPVELEKRGLDPARLPPGQYFTERFPVLHAGVVPEIDIATWDFTVDGLVGTEQSWTLEEFKELPTVELTADIHCVTKWSKFDTQWRGVPTIEVARRVEPAPAATHVLVRAEHGFTANLPLEDFLRDENLFAYEYGGEELESSTAGRFAWWYLTSTSGSR